jgi:purine-binding chemotaxis protein CheW
MDIQLVIFELSDEVYGVDVAQVRSIIPIQEISVVPGASAFVEGVINLRGDIVPVVDLRTRFSLPLAEVDKKSVIVIVEVNDLLVGLVVDKVREVVKIPETAVEPPSPLLTSVDTTYLQGIGKLDEDQILILLDLDRIFSLDEYQSMAETVLSEA